MKWSHLILRYGEIFLKGKNRRSFEAQLVRNIKAITEQKDIMNLRSRYILPYFENYASLKKVFGLVSYSLAQRSEKDENAIAKLAVELLKDKKGTFRVSTQRSDKSFHIKSPDMNRLVGEYIESKTDLTFLLKEFDHHLHIEINTDGAYLYLEAEQCFGGLPVGTGGEAVVILDDSDASVLAALLVMKRGVVPRVYYSGNLPKKSIDLLAIFSAKEIQSEEFSSQSDLLEKMQAKHLKVLVSGQDFAGLKEFEIEQDIVVLRPLIGFSKKEIEQLHHSFSKVS